MTIPTYEPYDFANRRHIGPSPAEMEEMLAACGVADLDELIDQTVPEGIRLAEPLDFGPPLSERGALDRLRATANKNRVLTSLIGLGYHGTITPPAIQRNVLENPFRTARSAWSRSSVASAPEEDHDAVADELVHGGAEKFPRSRPSRRGTRRDTVSPDRWWARGELRLKAGAGGAAAGQRVLGRIAAQPR